jgi:hypothetical protein
VRNEQAPDPPSSSLASGMGIIASSSMHERIVPSKSSTRVSAMQPPRPSLVDSVISPGAARRMATVSMSVAPPTVSSPTKTASRVTGPCASQNEALGARSVTTSTGAHRPPRQRVAPPHSAVVDAGSHIAPSASVRVTVSVRLYIPVPSTTT